MTVRQAVVMVGGKGTRLLPLTETRSKIVLPVADRPCLWYLLRSLAEGGIKEVILACGYKSDHLMRTIGDGSNLGLDIVYSFEDEPLGTGGAMKLVEDRLDDTFVAVNGDVFASIDISGQIAMHQETGADVTISLASVDDPCNYGIVRVEPDGRITEFKEKPKPEEVFSNRINSGVYIVQRSVLADVPEGTFYDFSKDLIPRLVEKGCRIQGFDMVGIWMDVGRPGELIDANLVIADTEFYGIDWKTPGCGIDGSFFLGKNATVNGCLLTDAAISARCEVVNSKLDRVLLMRGCEVRGATIRNSILGEGCKVGKGAKISNAVLRDGTVVGPGEEIDEGKNV